LTRRCSDGGNATRVPIAVVIESMAGGGAQQVLSQLLAHWDACGRETVLITLRGAEVDAFPVPVRTRRLVIGGAGASRNPVEALVGNVGRVRALRKALRASGAAVVVSFLTPMNITAILASRGLGIPIIVCERNDPRRQPLGLAWRLLRMVSYRFADSVTVNSMGAAVALRPLARSVTYLPNPLRTASDASIGPKRGHLLLAVGRLHRQKRFDLLLEAFASQRADLHEWTLRILGTGPEQPALAERAADLGIEVEFPGYVADPFPHYRAADIFVMPSDYEGSPNALWEAMSCGAACVVSSGVVDAAWAMEQGAVADFHVGDSVSLGDAIASLASEPRTRERLGALARDAAQRFEAGAALAAWDEEIDRVVSEFRPRAARGVR